ncbi:hypothetical protein EFA69_16040 [Rufibacter immobilis]|uniref:Uncharacterized protein n=1 Tax=Rufibacter immobilis TaxID=1348778 RepID=A0A3M9MQZ9_9BACT|nr:hypothetical protein [Rufibacter immobilis]RNI27627.1 hypothetical protein EFA69_16040 [Rufibacter immobilis]
MKDAQYYHAKFLVDVRKLLIGTREELKKDRELQLISQETFDACDRQAEDSIKLVEMDLEDLKNNLDPEAFKAIAYLKNQ